MDLAQKANRVKRDLQAAVHKPEATSIRHALDAFEAFADGVVEEIGQIKAALKAQGAGNAPDAPVLGEGVVAPPRTVDVTPALGEPSERDLEREPAR